MAKCQYKIGFLTLRDCSNTSIDNCCSCNRPLCNDHKHLFDEKSFCPDCFQKQKHKSEKKPDEINRVVIYNSIGYHPIYFGHHHGFGYDSYTHFDSTNTTGTEITSDTSGETMETSDFQDS